MAEVTRSLETRLLASVTRGWLRAWGRREEEEKGGPGSWERTPLAAYRGGSSEPRFRGCFSSFTKSPLPPRLAELGEVIAVIAAIPTRPLASTPARGRLSLGVPLAAAAPPVLCLQEDQLEGGCRAQDPGALEWREGSRWQGG